MTFRVRFERPVGDAFDEELLIAFEEKLRDRADARNSGEASAQQAKSYVIPGDVLRHCERSLARTVIPSEA